MVFIQRFYRGSLCPENKIADLRVNCVHKNLHSARLFWQITFKPFDEPFEELVKKSIRLHWGIENRLHWCLDMTFNEDYKRHRKDHSPENMTVMRRLALNILRQAEKPENKKQDSLSKRMIWFRENRQFRQTVLRLL